MIRRPKNATGKKKNHAAKNKPDRKQKELLRGGNEAKRETS